MNDNAKELMEQQQEAGGKLGFQGVDLLEEKLSQKDNQTSRIGWNRARDTVKSFFGNPDPNSEVQRIELDEQPAQEPETQAAPATQEIPEYFHSLNDRLERQQQAIDKREREQRQWLEQIQRQQSQYFQQQQAQQAPPDNLYQEFGLASPEALIALEQRIIGRAAQHVEPLKAQLAYEKFQNAFQKASAKNEHFGKYFDFQDQQQKFATLLNQAGADRLLSVNWEKEYDNAYFAADGQRRSTSEADLKKQVEELQAQLAGKQAAKDSKQQKTNNLHLVPKANQQGRTAPASTQVDDEFASAGKGKKRRGFTSLSRQLKSKYGLA